ncbi:MAG: TetR/AcrR family transcriptional regulator [Clostridia bacterium]|nr:TetR/AcrR family transcriptional regulator [Clostridia bacterium]
MKEKQIIEAARMLFNKYGFKKVTMDEIAREANVTKRTVYSYFSSKEELFKCIINEELENMKKIVEDVEAENLKNGNQDFYGTVHQGIYKLLKYINKRKFLKNLVNEAEILKNPIIIENLKVIDSEVQNYIKQKLQDAINKGYIKVKDVDIVAFLIYKMYIALMFDWNENNKKLDENIIADNIISILKTGLNK